MPHRRGSGIARVPGRPSGGGGRGGSGSALPLNPPSRALPLSSRVVLWSSARRGINTLKVFLQIGADGLSAQLPGKPLELFIWPARVIE